MRRTALATALAAALLPVGAAQATLLSGTIDITYSPFGGTPTNFEVGVSQIFLGGGIAPAPGGLGTPSSGHVASTFTGLNIHAGSTTTLNSLFDVFAAVTPPATGYTGSQLVPSAIDVTLHITGPVTGTGTVVGSAVGVACTPAITAAFGVTGCGQVTWGGPAQFRLSDGTEMFFALGVLGPTPLFSIANDANISAAISVPEPGSIPLLGLGALVAAGVFSRKRLPAALSQLYGSRVFS
jgi:hypothetical protein